MEAQWTPMRWPSAWKDPNAVNLLQGTGIDCLVIGAGDDLAPVRSRAREAGLHVADLAAPPAGVAVVKGEWPGVKTGRNEGQTQTGPTGVPWVDSNGWAIRLARAEQPEAQVWVDAPPAANAVIAADSYLIAMADSAAYGGRWIISLDNALAAAMDAQKPEAEKPWARVKETAAFFAAHQAWREYAPFAVLGVISDFSGANEFFSRELLNLLARAGQHCRVLLKREPCATDGLRALLYADAEPLTPALRKQILDFVEGGGLLITHQWPAPLERELPAPVDGFSMFAVGKGKIAISKEPPTDPYAWANDSVILVSHRYDLVRFWNGGAAASYYTVSPDRRRAVVHLLFYSYRGPDAATVRIVGRYRAVRVATVDSPQVAGVQMEARKDAVEIHLPQVSQYVALQLEA
jgi:hypothetical protein